jgi:plastocyanin
MNATNILTLVAACNAIACGSNSSGASGSTSAGTTQSGCTLDTAEDMTAAAAVEITAIQPWSVPHQACVRVKSGAHVTWKGDFGAHPLAGGFVGEKAPSSPITKAAAGVTGMGEVNATLNAFMESPGTYPYFCTAHPVEMQGVVIAE